MVLLGRIELPTSPLPRVRSTTELQQPGARCMAMHVGVLRGRAIGGARRACQAKLHTLVTIAAWCDETGMASGGTNTPDTPATTGPMTREERLAAQLRANLRRRKAQARAIAKGDGETDTDGGERATSD